MTVSALLSATDWLLGLADCCSSLAPRRARSKAIIWLSADGKQFFGIHRGAQTCVHVCNVCTCICEWTWERERERERERKSDRDRNNWTHILVCPRAFYLLVNDSRRLRHEDHRLTLSKCIYYRAYHRSDGSL